MTTLENGTRLGRYEIRSLLGEGGMGEVYLAEDIKLDRKVALKILPVEFSSDRERLERFVREAKATSALNHPNIITIHEIDQFDSVHFMTTEFVDGENLRNRIQQASLKLSEVLNIATQIASALSAAHTASIVHRDIKPENVMLRRDGIVKVLDFGLAKLTARLSPESVDTDAPTRAVVKTDPGVVMGTAVYMSPEQARGLEVDARTDIFSLGVVIYEMVAGRLPFEGRPSAEVMAAILSDKEPQPLARYSTGVPAELERIVSKALKKQREQRYQTAQDLMLDLQTLKQQLEFEAIAERTAPDSADTEPSTVKSPATIAGQGRETLGAESVSSKIKIRRLSLSIGIAVILVATLGLFLILRYRSSNTPIKSIAILPLVNASNDPNSEYLSDGITESIISSLSQLPQLKVMARSTVFHFKGKDIDPRVVGQQLQVQAVMEGRLLQQGDHLVIRTELVNVADGTQIWGGEYERKLSDVLAVQEEISREISEKLRLRLTGEDKKRLTGRDPANSDSYQAYLKGRYYWNKRTAEGLKKAIEEFQKAVDSDPGYALGYTGLADTYLLLEQVAGVPTSQTLPKARAAVDHALQIDSSLAEVHTSSAQIYQESWQWQEAEAEFKRAISLNPNYPTAHLWYSTYLRNRLRFDDSFAEIMRAQEIDPLSSIIGTNLAYGYYLKNDLQAAIAQNKKVIELTPDFPIAYGDLGWFYMKQQRYDEAVTAIQKAIELSGRSSLYLGTLGACYARMGKRAEALQIAKELEDRYARHQAIGFFIATVYAALEDKNQVFSWLEKDYGNRSAQLPGTQWWANFENSREDPRYLSLVQRMGLNPQGKG